MKIAVVIPAFDVEEWVATAIDSVLGQDQPPDEIIVVDDGSSDSTAEIASGYPEVRLLQQSNRGLAAARNAGAAAASTDAVLFLDADDALLPGAIRILCDAATKGPAFGAVIPNYVRSGFGDGTCAWPENRPIRVIERQHVPSLIRSNHLSPNSLVRKAVWQRHMFSEDLRACEDLDFWLRLVLDGESLAVLSDPLVVKTIGRKGALSDHLVLMRASRREVCERLWERSDMSRMERWLVAYQLVRVSAGEAAARRAVGETWSSARACLSRSRNKFVRVTAKLVTAPGCRSGVRLIDALRR